MATRGVGVRTIGAIATLLATASGAAALTMIETEEQVAELLARLLSR